MLAGGERQPAVQACAEAWRKVTGEVVLVTVMTVTGATMVVEKAMVMVVVIVKVSKVTEPRADSAVGMGGGLAIRQHSYSTLVRALVTT